MKPTHSSSHEKLWKSTYGTPVVCRNKEKHQRDWQADAHCRTQEDWEKAESTAQCSPGKGESKGAAISIPAYRTAVTQQGIGIVRASIWDKAKMPIIILLHGTGGPCQRNYEKINERHKTGSSK